MADNTSNAERNLRQLKDEQQVRQRPAPIFGTNDEKGAFHSVEEIIANSIDEAREGYGKSISVTVEKGDIITVEDHGRGLPMDWNDKEKEWNWKLALCTLYASGKYDASQYGNSLGLNGLGLTATQYASSFMDVEATYDGNTRIMHFKKGRPVGDMQVVPAAKGVSGTKIRFQPDPEVFPALSKTNLDSTMFIPVLNSQAMLQDGLEILFSHYDFDNQVKRFYYEKGMAEFVDAILEDNKILPQAAMYFDKESGTDVPDDLENYPPYELSMKMAFNFCRDASVIQVYHNSSLMFEGGTSVDGLERGFTQAFTDVARNNNKIGKSEKFLFKDISCMLVCVAETNAPGNRTWFKNQTKGAINNPFIGKAFTQFVYNKVRYWLENNKAMSDKILAEAVNNKQAREEGEAVSKKVLSNLNKQVKFGNKPKDFHDCASKSVFERELYIVEGRSALGSVKQARDHMFQAVMPVRGKPINCLKEKITRVLNNDIIIDLFRVFGCGMEVKSKYIEDLPQFDLNKLNWGKLIICTDADVDGMHIRALLLTMFYILAPSLLKAGKVFIAETPLYEMTWKDTTRFAFDDNEKKVIYEQFLALGAKESQIKIQRSKGLGENNADMMSISTMRPDTRRLIPVEYPSDDSNLRTYFEALLGDDIETRRILIDEYFDMVDGNLD